MDKDFNSLVIRFFSSIIGFEPEIEIDIQPEEIFINLKLDQEKSGLLIGHHGEVLTSAQLILTLMHQQLTGTRLPVRLNVNDYRQQRQKALENLADTVAQKSLERQAPVSIGNLTSYERRIIHTYLSGRSDVTTHSEGEPPYRVLVVSPI